MLLEKFSLPPLGTNCYVVACPQTGNAAVIDAPPKSTVIICRYLKEHQLQLKKILLTHSHWDHIADVFPLFKETGAEIYIHPLDALNLENPGSDGLQSRVQIMGIKPHIFLKDGDKIQVGNEVLTVIHTPGHSPGGVCYYHEKDHLLFSGDTLFRETIGNLSLPTCQPELMWDSLDKLSRLPKQTVVYPGHGPSTTIGEESWLSQAKQRFG